MFQSHGIGVRVGDKVMVGVRVKVGVEVPVAVGVPVIVGVEVMVGVEGVQAIVTDTWSTVAEESSPMLPLQIASPAEISEDMISAFVSPTGVQAVPLDE